MSPAFVELEAQLAETMLVDRHRLWRALRNAEQAALRGNSVREKLAELASQIAASVQKRQARQQAAPKVTLDPTLPVSARQEDIARAIQENQVVVVCGETGSGKSTQLPKLCLALGRGAAGLIGHTQPRRIAARAVAARVAQELGVSLGAVVGFQTRFADATSPQTMIKLMTDGILLAETEHDRFLNRYDTLIIDEAHERSLNVDFLVGYLTRLLPKRPELKVIITSATIDAARFSEHFAQRLGRRAPVIDVAGRTYPVEVRYRPLVDDEGDEADCYQALAAAVDELISVGLGDILVFLPTEQHIREATKTLRGHGAGRHASRGLELLPLYARLSAAEQNRVFEPHNQRRIVLATNVAESSLTVPGIHYVIDAGTARIARYSPRSKVERLPIEAVSRASADQRKGRCGRIGPGVCIRLYDEADYLSRDAFTSPEIQRSNLAAVILHAMALRLGPLDEFPFLDPPKPTAIQDGYHTLFELGAIDNEQQLTPLGKQLARLPVDPRIGRIVLAGQAEGCLHEILIIAAALELQDPRERPVDKQQAADEKHARFQHAESDFLSCLLLWDFYQKLKHELSRSKLRTACRQNFLSYNRLQEWVDVHQQLLRIAAECGLRQQGRRDDYGAIHRALLAGLLSNVAFKGDIDPEEEKTTARGNNAADKPGDARRPTQEYSIGGGMKFLLWPGSGVYAAKPQWIVAAELVETSRRYVRTVGRIQPEWIEPLAGHLVKRSYSEPRWQRTSGTVLADEKVSLFGLTIVPRRTVRYGPIEPVYSRRLFIEALIAGEFDTRSPFLAENRALAEQLEALEAKSRQPGLLVGEAAQFEFYARRIPADVYDATTFKKWFGVVGQAEPKLLHMTRADLMNPAAEEASAAEFPDELVVGRLRFPLDYHLAPGDADDGVTVTVPRAGLAQLSPQRLDWLAPGLLEEKVTALIKALPKQVRRALIPAGDTARAVLEQLRYGEGDLHALVAAELSRIGGERVSPEMFELERLPPHLRMIVKVVDDGGATVAKGRDLRELRAQVGASPGPPLKVSAKTAAIEERWRRDDLRTWDFGDLPEHVDIERGGFDVHAFPALVDAGDSARLRLFDSADAARQAMRAGLRRLFILTVKTGLKSAVSWIPKLDEALVKLRPLAKPAEWKQQLEELVADRAAFGEDETPSLRTAAEFTAWAKVGRERLTGAAQDAARLLPQLAQAYQQARLALEPIKAPHAKYAVEDVREQLAALLPSGFLTTTPWTSLEHLPRYLQGVHQRLTKLATGLARDRGLHDRLQPFWRRYMDRRAKHDSLGVADPELAHYRWLVEEFRVSLFAQTLGTAVSVSPERLEKQWAKVQS